MIGSVFVVGLSIFTVVTCHSEPTIGILTEEVTGSLKEAYPNYTSYIAASYVKAVQSAGARVVPIFIGRSKDYYRNTISLLNGIVFPGGACLFNVANGYAEAGMHIFDIASEINQNGDYFPILGVCLGFELMLYWSNDRKDLRTKCSSMNLGLPLFFMSDFKKSQLYKDADDKIISILESYPVTSNHHRRCITPNNLKELGLNKNWKILSVNKDKYGLHFISSIEARTLPFVGIQFHPEKNMYEWKKSQNNPHSEEAILSARYFYDWIVREANRNNHTFPSDIKINALIENYPTHFSGKLNLTYNEVYLFQ